MEAIEIFKAQHRLIEQLFQEIERATAPEAKLRLARELAEKLLLHMELEEGIFYPCASAVNSDLTQRNYKEHATVKAALARLARAQAEEEEFSQCLRETLDLVVQHVREEESELFPQCMEALSQETLDELSVEVEEKLNSIPASASSSDLASNHGVAP